MPQAFNPPPNWPQPPVGWRPPSSWQPDPSWGPAPPGWQLWVEEQDKVATGVRVFISYRRSDAQSQANGLYDGLSLRLPDAKIFMDIDSIPVGADFENYIRGEIEICDIVLVLIGDNWLDARPGTNVRRIDEPGDFVRLEVESAFASPRVRVIPVLVEDASMPGPSELPVSLARLSRLNAIELSDKRWKSDLERLTDFLRGTIDEERREASREYAQNVRATPTTTSAPPAPAPHGAASPTFPTYVPPPPQLVSRRPEPAWHSERTGWIVAFLPMLCCGLAVFAPFLRAALLRPHDKSARKRLAIWGASLQGLAIVAFVIIGLSPQDAEGSVTGPLGNIGAVLILASVVPAIIWGVTYRKPPQPE